MEQQPAPPADMQEKLIWEPPLVAHLGRTIAEDTDSFPKAPNPDETIVLNSVGPS